MTLRVGVGVIVQHAGRVLLGRRVKPRVWQFPGGWLEEGESYFDCAVRETLEETGLQLERLRQGPATRIAMQGDLQTTIFVFGESACADARCCEPDKCTQWSWFEWQRMPEPLFAPTRSLLATGLTPSFAQ